MAVKTNRSYHLVGANDTGLQQFAGASAVIISSSGTTIIVTVNNDANAIQALDDYMATIGYGVGASPSTGSIIPYAPDATIAFGLVQYVGFGGSSTIEDLANWAAPRAATCQNLQINVPSNTLSGATTFTIRKSVANAAFAVTALTITVGAFVTGLFLDADSFAVGVGDRVSLEVVAGGLAGVITFTGGLEVA